MAVIDEVPGLEVAISVAGEEAVEYDDPHANEVEPAPRTVTKYIESVDDAEFVIHVRAHRAYIWGYKGHELMAKAYLDGSIGPGKYVSQDYRRAKICDDKSYDAATQQWISRKIKFSSVTISEGGRREDVESDMRVARNLGIIEIQVRRVIKHPAVPSRMNEGYSASSKLHLSEKALKGKSISHSASYSEGRPCTQPHVSPCDYLDEDNGPIAIFKFLYRSRDSLKRELIIPRSPSPSPRLADPLDQLSREELRKLARERMDELKAGTPVKTERVIKREFSTFIDLTDDFESPSRSTKMARRGSPDEIIDLTDD